MKVFTRVAGLLVLGAILLIGPTASPAATPASGTIGPPNGSSVSWTGQQYPIGHAVALPDQCPPAIDPLNLLCDHFYVNVNVPASHWDSNTGGMDVLIEWASVDDDFDLYIYDVNGTQVGFSGAGGTTSERAFIQNASSAGSPYEVRVVPFLMTSAPLVGYNGKATFVSQAGGPAPNPVRSTGGLAFAPPTTIVDAQRTEGEPLNYIDQDGNYWDSGPYGFSTGQSWVHRSTDGGNQFNIVSFVGLRPNAPPGGGDTDVVVDDQGDAYFVDLEGLAELSCAVSEDDGNNWTTNQACVADTVVDRQWFAMDNGPTPGPNDNTVFLAYRQVPLGSFIYSTQGADDPIPGGGVAYANSSADLVNPVSQGAPCGQMRFDPVDRYVYYPCIQGDHVEITRAQIAPGQRTGIVYTNVQAPPSPGGGPVGDLFPSVATDSAGNLYAVWIDETDHNVYYAASTDHGTTWGPVQQINGNDANSNEFMWAQGGAPGTLAVAWLGNSSHLDSDLMPSWYNNRQAAAQFKWFGYASLIRNATASSPSFVQTKFTDQPSHYGQICNQGLFCTVSMGDRTMADYFSMYLDLDGSMRIVYNDTTSQHHGAHVFEVRQVAGPTAAGTTISKAVPKNPVTDPTGDAQSPHYSPAGTGPNQPHLDFTKLELSKPNAATLRVKMTLQAPPFGAVPLGETSNVWLTRFQALSVGDEGEESYRIFYVGAESAGGLAPLTFFAGSGRSANNAVPGNGCTTTTPENCKILQYPNEAAATGSVSGNVITIDVPVQGGFGPNRPILGNTLHNVTALSAGRGNLGLEIADIYADLDATKSFDFPLSGGGGPPPPPPPPPGGGGCKVTGGGSIQGGGRFSLNPHQNLHGKVKYDDGAAADFRSTRLTEVTCNPASHSATVEGEGVNNGHAVTFTVEVIDNGEPGSSDVFGISLSDGYTRSGTLSNGNIQVHE
jgi:hypothetical protein